MRQLRLVGLNEDGSRLVLRDEGAKTDFLLPLDERLSAALRGDRARLGQLEINLEPQLRPREMQSRVRAGESPEQVAAAAALPLDRVLRFVAPVIAEREHIVEQARRAAVRRAGADGPGPVLEPTVLDRLRPKGVTEDDIGWDAWRRDDGRWTVQVAYRLDGRDRVAQWSYDAGGRSAIALDEDAHGLTGQRPAAAAVVAPVSSREVSDETEDDEAQRLWDAQPPRLARVPDRPLADPTEAAEVDAHPYDAYNDADPDDAGADVAEGRAGGRNARRAHVPSWDEIMFGKRRARD